MTVTCPSALLPLPEYKHMDRMVYQVDSLVVWEVDTVFCQVDIQVQVAPLPTYPVPAYPPVQQSAPQLLARLSVQASHQVQTVLAWGSISFFRSLLTSLPQQLRRPPRHPTCPLHCLSQTLQLTIFPSHDLVLPLPSLTPVPNPVNCNLQRADPHQGWTLLQVWKLLAVQMLPTLLTPPHLTNKLPTNKASSLPLAHSVASQLSSP